MAERKAIAMILGGSSGFGGATALKLAKEGYDVVIVHRDRRSDMEAINQMFNRIKATGAQCFSFNQDAVVVKKQALLWQTIKGVLQKRKIKVLVHSIAKGNLKPLHGGKASLSNRDFQLTAQAMALSFMDWVQQIYNDGYFEEDARVIAFTSEGSTKVIPNYAAVSAAKASLESIIKSIAVEFAFAGIRANCIQAGVADTKSFRMIPDYQEIKQHAKARNPNNRLTVPEDVANAVYVLTLPEAAWITGNIIKADGGESLR